MHVVIIGSGPGGMAAAEKCASLGAQVTVIEQADAGGTCLHRGCIPTKAMASSAKLFAHMHDAESLGIYHTGSFSISFAEVQAHARRVVERLQKGIAYSMKANRMTLLRGTAVFSGTQSVTLLETGRTISFDKAVIATGSRPAWPASLPHLPGMMDSSGFLGLDALPKRLTVIGGGYIGSEMACIAAAMGAQVTLLEMMDDILLLLDKDVRNEIKRSMKKKLGIKVSTGIHISEIVPDGGALCITTKEGLSLCSDAVLVAAGRRPETEGLALDLAGVSVNEAGYIPVDDHGRTSNQHVFAAGDVTGRMQLAHAASDQGCRAGMTLMGLASEAFETVIPGVIFTQPEAAIVGITEEMAKAQGIPFKRAKTHFLANGRAVAAQEPSGFVMMMIHADSGVIIGAQAVGPSATELISEMTLAIRNGMDAASIASTVHAHPTLSESWQKTAMQLVEKRHV
ncbi:MAG: dihydrolipoyl dehydrogenase [Spartobacteria bacterium]|nr:dihydrolipoyl dehydrogenase [Spartobacteria bacterium]